MSMSAWISPLAASTRATCPRSSSGNHTEPSATAGYWVVAPPSAVLAVVRPRPSTSPSSAAGAAGSVSPMEASVPRQHTSPSPPSCSISRAPSAVERTSKADSKHIHGRYTSRSLKARTSPSTPVRVSSEAQNTWSAPPGSPYSSSPHTAPSVAQPSSWIRIGNSPLGSTSCPLPGPRERDVGARRRSRQRCRRRCCGSGRCPGRTARTTR